AERLHHEVGVDAADAGCIDLALRRRAEHAEVDALRRETRFAPRAGARRLADEIAARLLEIPRHLVRERLDDADRDQRRRVPLITARRPSAVALEERVVGLRTRAVRSAHPVARRTGERLGSAEEPLVHAT